MAHEKLSLIQMLLTYVAFSLIVVIGYIQEIIESFLFTTKKSKEEQEKALFSKLDSFYYDRMLRRIADCFCIVITGVPGRTVKILDRFSINENKSFIYTGRTVELINFASYNYLGFASNKGHIIKKVIEASNNHMLILAGSTRDLGVYDVVSELEREMATFLKKEDCIVFPMGYGTNTANIPILFDEGTLIPSDELNHASIITGLRLSRSIIKIFKHNDMYDLERRLIFLISQGQPLTHRAWKKIIVMVEGIYSMEGTIVKLNRLVELKRKYKFYIFVDEAHSIGALGRTGRGVCEHHNVNFDDVDILMGTFTKSFGGMGGYIASSEKLITHLRFFSDFSLYGDQMSPIIATQVLESLRYIKETKRGAKKLLKLRRNVKLMRGELKRKGFIVLGSRRSPVIPILISNPGKMGELARICREEGIAIVIVGYPATPLLFGRVRLCISSSHTKEDIFKAVRIMDQAGDLLGIKIHK